MIGNQHIFALWDELAVFPASQIDRACLRLMESISNWIGADNAAWIGAVRLLHGAKASRDSMSGWRVKVIAYLVPPTPEEALAAQKIVAGHEPEPGPTTVAVVKTSGTFRVHRLYDGFVNLNALRKTVHYRAYYQAFGVDDRMWVGSPISPETESYFVFDKRKTASRFSRTDAKLAGFAVRGLTWFQRQLFISHGLHVAQQPLTSTERRILQLLLTEKSEKQIADAMCQSPHTTHGYVKEIFRKFNVKSRAGLMAIWLSRA
jgi:DNA-binding CsgD family transcriptional regulator